LPVIHFNDKCLCAVIMIYATLANIQTDAQADSFSPAYMNSSAS